ncbi:MAG: hypothetical protein KDA97_07195 [Acidimicrobiales bacterium]|nr:hypothetical protein [Acidimicrobiales bacterium]
MNPLDAPEAGTTRRQLLRAGTLGAAAAAVLAACGTTDDSKPGESGVAPEEAEVTPTVPLSAPSASDLRYNQTLLRTAASLELLAADAYEEYGANLPEGEPQADAARFAADHTAAAADFNEPLPADLVVEEANPVLMDAFVAPVAPDLIDAPSTYDFFHVLESTIAATYVVAVGDYAPENPDDTERTTFAGHASAAARRATVLGGGGEGLEPADALFDTVDLIPNEAYLTVEDPNAPVEDDTAEGDDATAEDGATEE